MMKVLRSVAVLLPVMIVAASFARTPVSATGSCTSTDTAGSVVTNGSVCSLFDPTTMFSTGLLLGSYVPLSSASGDVDLSFNLATASVVELQFNSSATCSGGPGSVLAGLFADSGAPPVSAREINRPDTFDIAAPVAMAAGVHSVNVQVQDPDGTCIESNVNVPPATGLTLMATVFPNGTATFSGLIAFHAARHRGRMNF
jgi:hypothetical protein